ncbi:hypothetical protein C8R43DRAFT_581164 [Mycena crocata]|nr:hypothetical protein C8R43DRAFT_581164 [Mycena crocata]
MAGSSFSPKYNFRYRRSAPTAYNGYKQGIKAVRNMHPQGVNSPTFSAAPLDGSLTLPQILDLQLKQSPNHTAYIYDDPQGEIVRINFSQYIGTVHAAARHILEDTAAYHRQDTTVIGIFAETDTLSYCMMSAAIMRAGLVPFCISPRNAAEGLADLLEKTNPAVVYVSTHGHYKAVLSNALAIAGKELPVLQALGFEKFLGSTFEPLPPMPRADMDSIGHIIHSSGSTSVFSKPIYLSHKMLLQYASMPWSGAQDFCGLVFGSQNLPNFHGAGLLMVTWPFSTGLIIGVLRPAAPPIPPTPKNALNAIIATKPDLVMAPPAAIEVWSEDPAGLKAMQSLKCLTYMGAPLNKNVGDALVANGVILCSTYASMETGLLSPFLECHGKDWDYFSVRKEIDVVRVPEDDGSKLYTHSYLVSSSYVTAYTNNEIDGKPGCSLSDLLEQHPVNVELHRIYGRKDEMIIFSSASKMNPVPIEAQINRNRFVDSALVFGQGRTHPGLIVQLKPEFRGNKSLEILDAIWASVQEVNKESPTHFQIQRKMILLADPQKPFALTSKFQPRKGVVFEDYREEIGTAYL